MHNFKTALYIYIYIYIHTYILYIHTHTHIYIYIYPHIYLQALEEELLQQVVPEGDWLVQEPLAHHGPVLVDGVAGQQVPHAIPDGGQALEATHEHQQAAHAAADVLLTPEKM